MGVWGCKKKWKMYIYIFFSTKEKNGLWSLLYKRMAPGASCMNECPQAPFTDEGPLEPPVWMNGPWSPLYRWRAPGASFMDEWPPAEHWDLWRVFVAVTLFRTQTKTRKNAIFLFFFFMKGGLEIALFFLPIYPHPSPHRKSMFLTMQVGGGGGGLVFFRICIPNPMRLTRGIQ